MTNIGKFVALAATVTFVAGCDIMGVGDTSYSPYVTVDGHRYKVELGHNDEPYAVIVNGQRIPCDGADECVKAVRTAHPSYTEGGGDGHSH